MKFEKYYKKVELADNEEILMVVKHHVLPYLHKIIIAVILILLPFFLMFSLIGQGPIGVSIFVALIILAVLFAAREYYVWSHNVFIVTNEKIIDLDQRGFFSRTVSEVPYKKVLDIAYTSKGILPTLIGTGTITVTTSIPNTILEISHVGKVKNIMAELTGISQAGGMRQQKDLSESQKIENFEEAMNYSEVDEIHQYQLKDLIEEYVETYSKDRLKKKLLEELRNK